MSLLRKLVLAVVVGVVVTLACVLIGIVLAALRVSVAVSVGDFLQSYASVLGVLAAIWWFIRGGFGIHA